MVEEEPEPQYDENGELIVPVKEEEEVVEPPKPPKKKYLTIAYSEEDYELRVPSEEYEEIKRIEDEILAFKKENIKTYVLAAGIMYGKGENILNSHFKKAWL